MSAADMAQRRSLCAMTGMAVGFRVFYQATVDGCPLNGSAWLSVLIGLVLALPMLLSLRAIRTFQPERAPQEAIRALTGTVVLKALAVLYMAALIYDAAAVMRIMSSAAKYVAMPQANRTLILLVTALTATACVGMGVRAAAGGAVLWCKLLAALLAVLVVMQIPYLRIGWLTPWLGGGVEELVRSALPEAGMMAFSAAAWLMLDPQHDQNGWSMLKTLAKSGLTTAALTALFCMLVPAMPGNQPLRVFRLGRLLTNGRGGLSLEMPYVVLLYAGFLTMLVFELAAGAKMLELLFPKTTRRQRAGLAGGCAFLIAALGGADQSALQRLSAWYFPIMACPAMGLGALAWARNRKSRRENKQRSS